MSLRDIRELLLERDIDVSHETSAVGLGILVLFLPNVSRKGFQDRETRFMWMKEVYWLWRAVDAEGDEIDIMRWSLFARHFFDLI